MRSHRLKALAVTGVTCAIVAAVAALLVSAVAIYTATGLVSGQSAEPTVSIASGEIPAGGSEVTRLSALDVNDPALCAFTVDVSYDRLVNVATDCDADPEGNFSLALCEADYTSDTVRVTGAAAEGITGDMPLMDITWCGLGNAGESTDLDVQVVSFKDCSTPPQDITPVADQDGVNVIVSGPPPADTDGDDFDDCSEAYMGTDPLDDCRDDVNDDAWPPDFSNDTVVDITDALTFVAHVPSALGSPTYDPRFDVDPDGVVDITDVFIFVDYFPSTCANP